LFFQLKRSYQGLNAKRERDFAHAEQAVYLKKGVLFMGTIQHILDVRASHTPDFDALISGGCNIYADHVEEVIYQIPGVLEVAVIGVPHSLLGEVPHAYIVKAKETALSEEVVLQHCKERLADYKVPSISFVSSLPKNATGKVLKRLLREQVNLTKP
jgi:acyl-CoA synthetase (AMP-forming)/AMP-acid ligase II